MTRQELTKWVDFMREHGIKRLSLKDMEVELGGSSSSYSNKEGLSEPFPKQGLFEDTTGSFCSCGHSWITEHSDDGCLLGCSHDLCMSSHGEPIVD